MTKHTFTQNKQMFLKQNLVMNEWIFSKTDNTLLE